MVQHLGGLLRNVEETFREDIGLICESHHKDDLQDLVKYPLNKPYGTTANEEANVQYAAILLRTSDLLHITNDRVPSMAALLINPRNPKSQNEWAKQKAVRRVRPKPPSRDQESNELIESDAVEVHAKFKEAEGYFGLTTYLQYAAKQLHQSHEWCKESQASAVSHYHFPWKSIDISHVEASGFVTKQFGFNIDQAKILDLLTGHTLYNDTDVVIRELVQNSLDAVRLRAHLDADGPDSYTPEIRISWDSINRILTVTDNGVGMSQEVIENNFLRAGSSRYQEPDFRKDFPDFASISRFGIGVLSTFMVADDVIVTTVHESESEARKLSLRDVHGQYLVRLLPKNSTEIPSQIVAHGTSVAIKLRPSAELTDIEALVRQWVVVPGCDVYLSLDNQAEKPIGHKTVRDALESVLVASQVLRIGEKGIRTTYGSPVEIKTVSKDGFDIAFAVSWNEWLQDWGYVLIDRDRSESGENPSSGSGVCIGGVRVTSQAPGFEWGGIAALANATGIRSPRTNVARSAIERTEEYDVLLGDVYEAYVGHIISEMRELETNRASSLTRAAQEASYLAEDLAKYAPASARIRNTKLRTVPAILLEEDGKRRACSLEDLGHHHELATVESRTIASFESVLRSVRGAASPSLKNLLEAMGSDEVLPAAPLLCGMGHHGLIKQMFIDEWEIARIATDIDGRTLEASWRKKTKDPIWWLPGSRTGLPSSFANRLVREASLGRPSSMVRTLLPIRPSELDFEAFDNKKKIVLCQGWILLLPGHSLLEIERTSGDVDEETRMWAISWLLGLLRDNGRRRYSLDSAGQASVQHISEVMNVSRHSGLLEILEEGSIRAALPLADVDPMDVQRWDRRQDPE